MASFPIQQHIPNKKLASIWKGPFSIIEVCEKNILLLKATPRAKTIKIHTNRVRLFNHLIDVVTDPVPAAEITKEEITAPIANEDDSDIFDERPFINPPTRSLNLL